MKKNTDQFNNNYEICTEECNKLVNIMNYYLGKDNEHIISIKTKINQLKTGTEQNYTHKDLCKIVSNLHTFIKNIKIDVKNTYNKKLTDTNINKINKLFINIKEFKFQQLNKQENICNDVPLNLTEFGKPLILGLDNFPIILTNNIEDSILLTYIEGVLNAYDIDLKIVKTFYELKAKRDLPYRHGVMVPYLKEI
jgi:hypothetical protein